MGAWEWGCIVSREATGPPFIGYEGPDGPLVVRMEKVYIRERL